MIFLGRNKQFVFEFPMTDALLLIRKLKWFYDCGDDKLARSQDGLDGTPYS